MRQHVFTSASGGKTTNLIFVTPDIDSNVPLRKKIMKSYEDRLKELLKWEEPTLWIQTILHSYDGCIENQVFVYYDKKCKGPENDWLSHRFSYLKDIPSIPGKFSALPRINGTFLFIDQLHKPRRKDIALKRTRTLNFIKVHFHTSKYRDNYHNLIVKKFWCNLGEFVAEPFLICV